MYSVYVNESKGLNLTTKEQIDLILQYQISKDPKDQHLIIVQYIRTILKIVDGFKLSYQNNSILEKEDFINTGIIGLLKGVERYNPEKRNGGSPNTFLFFHIRKSMQELKQKNLDLVFSTKEIKEGNDLNKVISYNNFTSDGEEYQNIIPSSYNLNKEIILEDIISLIEEDLTDEEKFILNLYNEEKTLQECSEIYSQKYETVNLAGFYNKRKAFFASIKVKLLNSGISLSDCV